MIIINYNLTKSISKYISVFQKIKCEKSIIITNTFYNLAKIRYRDEI